VNWQELVGAFKTMANFKTTGGVVFFGVVSVGVLAVLAVADGQMFRDAAFSDLYRFTLEQAFSRFDASDQQVPAGGSKAAAAGASDPMEAIMVAQPRMGTPAGGGRTNPMGGMQQGQQYVMNPMAGAGQQAAQPQNTAGTGPHMDKGKTHLSTNQFDKAVEEFRLAVRDNPADQIALHSLGDALRGAGKLDEAISTYRQVLAINSAYYCCHTHIAEIARTRGDASTARTEYGAAISGYKEMLTQGGPIASNARYHLAKIYHDTDQNLDEALELATQSAAENVDQFAYLQLLAQIYEKLGRKPDAIAAYEQLKKTNPQFATMFDAQIQRLQQGATATQGPPPPADNPGDSSKGQ
jgi:tetratricopeptide (TPR) repeat protein